MIRYRDLTEAQKIIMCNGCGPKAGWLPVPEFFCHASCDHHDFNYWIGHTEGDRRKADLEFLQEMLKDANVDPIKQTISITYWLAVRVFGAACFHYAEKERDETDLAAALLELTPT
ncbi:hypothetical protein D4R52_01625 [bacterium]|nr:MAG: hypothetical protein D4R52_01625 [bacterium]